MKITPQLISSTELLANVPAKALHIKSISDIEDILEGLDIEHYGIMLMPYRLVPLVQKYKGEQHTGERILFTGGTLLWIFCNDVQTPTFINGIDLPLNILEYCTFIMPASQLSPECPKDVSVFNVTVIENGIVVPGGKYSHSNGKEYEVLATCNADRDLDRIKDYPLLVAYREIGSHSVWTRHLGDFVTRFKLKPDQPDSFVARLALVTVEI